MVDLYFPKMSSCLGKISMGELQDIKVSEFLGDIGPNYLTYDIFCLPEEDIRKKFEDLGLHHSPIRYDKLAEILIVLHHNGALSYIVDMTLRYFDFLKDYVLLRNTILTAVTDCPEIARMIALPGNAFIFNIDFCLEILDKNPYAYRYLHICMRQEPVIILRALSLDNEYNSHFVPWSPKETNLQ